MSQQKGFAAQLKHYWNHAPQGKFLSIKETGSLGLYAMGTSSFYNLMLFYLVTVIFIPYYYHIKPVHAYGILLIGNFLNMVMQPILGNAMEQTNTKLGRYKPYIIGTLPFLIVFTVLATFVPSGLGETGNIIYAYLTCVPSIFLTNFAYNMYQTMPTVITPNSQERDDVMSPVGLVFGLAPSILLLIMGPVRSAFAGQEYWAIRIFGILVAVLGGLGMLCVLNLRERVVQVTIQTEKVTIRKAMKMLAKNKPLWIMSIALCLGSLREFWRFFSPMFSQVTFSSNINTALDVMGIPMTLMGLGVTIAMVIMPILTRKLNKRGVISVLTVVNGIACLIMGCVGFQRIPIGPVSIVVQTILFLIASLGNGVLIMLPMIIGDIADYQQSISGKRLEGHIQNFIITIPLLFSQAVMFGLSFFQEALGFDPSKYSTDTMKPIEILADGTKIFESYGDDLLNPAFEWFNWVCIISAISSFLLILVVMFYPLSKSKHKECIEKIIEEYGGTDEMKASLQVIGEQSIGPNGEITPPKQTFTGAELSAMLSEGLDINSMTDKEMKKWLKAHGFKKRKQY